MRRKFIIFLIFLAAGIGIFGLYYSQKNTFSKDVLKLEILGPAETEIYQEVEYLVRYKNIGNVLLEEPRLIFEYPEHAITENNTLREEIKLDDVYPGQEKTLSFKARLVGEEDRALTAQVTLSYQPKNLKARYESTTTLTTLINSVPFNFGFDLPSKTASGKEMKFALNYFSNINYPLSNLKVKIEYPSDFEFLESDPPALEETDWEIPPLNKAEGGRIEITGRIQGEVGEEKVFTAEFGTWQEGEFILFKKTIKGVEIVKPALYITQEINGNPNYIANPGDPLHYEISFKNIGGEALSDLSLVVTLTGEAFDFNTLKTLNGEYKPGDNSIIWDWRRMGALQFLNVQQEGKVEFWLNLKNEWQNPSSEGKTEIKDEIYLSQAKEEFINKVNSKLEISQKGYRQAEVWENSGPLPPQVGQTTTYTIIWQAKNYYNEVKNIKVKAILPQNVKLTGKIFPETEAEKLTFDSQSREIVWDVGDLKVGQGVFNSAPNNAFQIAFTPDVSQRGGTPQIIGQAKITGEDSWTGQTLETAASSVNTALPDDQTLTKQQGIVQ